MSARARSTVSAQRFTTHLGNGARALGGHTRPSVLAVLPVCLFAMGLGVFATAYAADGGAPEQPSKVRVRLDRSRCPSAGSGVECSPADMEEKWVELDDLVSGPEAPPLLKSGPEAPGESARGTPGPTLSFNGVIGSPTGLVPPDTHMAVGPGAAAAGRVVMVTNQFVQLWDKTGAVVAGPTGLGVMFPPAAGSRVFDPKVLYDQHSGRFFIVVLERNILTTMSPLPIPATSFIRMAVSTSGAPNSLTAADWVFTSGSGNILVGVTPTWADYPTIGADANALIVTTNQYPASGATPGSNIRVFNKASLMGGVYGFVDLPPVLSNWTIQPAHVYGVTDSGGFYLINRVGMVNPVTGTATYRLHHLTGLPGAPVRTSVSFNTAAGFYDIPTFFAPQCTSTERLHTNDTRILNAVYQGGHLYWTSSLDPDNDGATEVVWQDLQTAGGAFVPTVTGGGFLDGGAGVWTYQPAINVNAGGDLALTYSSSSAGACASMNYNVRNPSDPPGTFGSVQTPITSAGFYEHYLPHTVWGFSNAIRWGDYAAVVRDPDASAATCFWAAHEYGFTSVVGTPFTGSQWGTRIVQFCTAPPTVACCLASNICADLVPPCPPGWTQRPAGSKCPTMGVVPGMHSGVTTVHWSNPAINCFNIVLRDEEGSVASASDCCQAHPGPGCDDAACQQQVCGQGVCVGGPNNGQPCSFPPDCIDGVCQGGGGGLPHCCQFQWDAACAQQAQDVCGTLCESAGGCIDGPKIDPWVTSTEPDEQTCNQFGSPDTPPIPADFFNPGSQPFMGQICYAGEPLGNTPPYGTFDIADTIVERFNVDPDRCAIPGYEIDIPIEIVALNLVSIQPITVTYNVGPPELWDVRVNLSDSLASPIGSMTVRKTHCNGGTWESTLPVQAKFTFTQVGNPGNVRVLDTGIDALPPDILVISPADNAPWVSDADPNFHFDSPWCTDFHPGIQDPNQETDCDCNGNLIKDSCDIENCPPGNPACADCNGNGRPDECDPDSDGDAVIDECDNCPFFGNSGQANSDGDAKGDDCDPCPFAGFAERDEDGDEVYDPEDNCPCVINRLQEDCNNNGIGDACDLLPCGTPGLTKGNDDVCVGGANAGVPCAQNADCPGGFCRNKNRFITAVVSPAATAHGLKVTITNLDANSVANPADYNGTDRWAVATLLNVSDGISPPFNAARLQCSPTTPKACDGAPSQAQGQSCVDDSDCQGGVCRDGIRDWSAVGTLHLYGDVVVPASTYDAFMCDSPTGPCSPALRLATARFGDVVAPVNTVNFQDVNSIVAKFQGTPAGPSKTRTKLTNSVVNPLNPVNFQEVSACVSAFQSKPFKTVVLVPPATCP